MRISCVIYWRMSKEREDSYSHILKYTSLFGSVQGLSIAVSLVRTKVVALLLGPDGMGLVALFNSVVSFISQSTNLGISTSAVRHISELGEGASAMRYINIVRWWCLLTGLLGMFTCVVLGPLLDRFTFTWGDHTLHFVLLSPIVLLTAMAGGELAILKGLRRLKALAKSQVFTLIASLLITIPIYYFFGESGIVPVLVLVALASLLSTLIFSNKVCPYSLGSVKRIGEGLPMVKLGIAFMCSGILGSGAEMLIRSLLNRMADLSTLGLYNAGYMLTFTYAGMVFTAMETDYYPRLSSVNGDSCKESLLANRQMEVSLLLVSPMIIALILVLPVLIPLLFSSSFSAVVPMAQVAILSMLLKSVTLPIAYLPLARGDSKVFMMLESSYFLVLVALVVVGYHYGGLYGTGVALLLAHMFDLLIEYFTATLRYGFKVSRKVVCEFLLQTIMAASAYIAIAVGLSPWASTAIGVVALSFATVFSFRILRSKFK